MFNSLFLVGAPSWLFAVVGACIGLLTWLYIDARWENRMLNLKLKMDADENILNYRLTLVGEVFTEITNYLQLNIDPHGEHCEWSMSEKGNTVIRCAVLDNLLIVIELDWVHKKIYVTAQYNEPQSRYGSPSYTMRYKQKIGKGMMMNYDKMDRWLGKLYDEIHQWDVKEDDIDIEDDGEVKDSPESLKDAVEKALEEQGFSLEDIQKHMNNEEIAMSSALQAALDIVKLVDEDRIKVMPFETVMDLFQLRKEISDFDTQLKVDAITVKLLSNFFRFRSDELVDWLVQNSNINKEIVLEVREMLRKITER